MVPAASFYCSRIKIQRGGHKLGWQSGGAAGTSSLCCPGALLGQLIESPFPGASALDGGITEAAWSAPSLLPMPSGPWLSRMGVPTPLLMLCWGTGLTAWPPELSKALLSPDVNECELYEQEGRPRLCMHTCVNTPGSYRCACPSGYRTLPDRKSCEGE